MRNGLETRGVKTCSVVNTLFHVWHTGCGRIGSEQVDNIKHHRWHLLTQRISPPDLYDLEAAARTSDQLDAVNLVVSPRLGVGVLHDMHLLGVKKLFIQPGADSVEVLSVAEELRLQVERGCVLVQQIPSLM